MQRETWRKFPITAGNTSRNVYIFRKLLCSFVTILSCTYIQMSAQCANFYMRTYRSLLETIADRKQKCRASMHDKTIFFFFFQRNLSSGKNLNMIDRSKNRILFHSSFYFCTCERRKQTIYCRCEYTKIIDEEISYRQHLRRRYFADVRLDWHRIWNDRIWYTFVKMSSKIYRWPN